MEGSQGVPLPAARSSRFQYGLSALLGAMATVAVVAAYWTTWRFNDRADTTLFSPGSAEAEQLFPEAVILPSGKGRVGSFTARYRDVRWLFAEAQNSLGDTSGYRAEFDQDRLILECPRRAELETVFDEMSRLDRLEAGSFVIRGVVLDPQGQPCARLALDLLGPHPSTGVFKTRADGTFTIPVRSPPGSGYCLRVRREFANSQLSRPFELEPSRPEVIVRLTVRTELAARENRHGLLAWSTLP